MSKTAAILIIGNEILSGKVKDQNGVYLSKELRDLGVDVRRIVVVADEVPVIAEEVAHCSGLYDWVFTTGGVGPTHDDVTMEGIARGLKRKVIRNPDLEGYLRTRYGSDVNEAVLRLADAPEGAELLKDKDLKFPVVKIANVFIFPGIPEVARRKFQVIKEMFREEPFCIRKVFLKVREEEIAHHLHTSVEAFPQLLLGSYPATDSSEHQVVLTLESKDPSYLESAFKFLVNLLGKEIIVKME